MSDLIQNADQWIYIFKSFTNFLMSILFVLLRFQRRVDMPLELEVMLLHRHPALIYCALVYFLWSLMSVAQLILMRYAPLILPSVDAMLSIVNSAALILLALQFVCFDQPFWPLQRYAQRFNKHVELLFVFSGVLGVIFYFVFKAFPVISESLFSVHEIEPLDFADWVLTTLALFLLGLGFFQALFENFKNLALFAVFLVLAQWLGNGYLIFIANEPNIRLMLMIPSLLEAPLLLLAIYSTVEMDLLD